MRIQLSGLHRLCEALSPEMRRVLGAEGKSLEENQDRGARRPVHGPVFLRYKVDHLRLPARLCPDFAAIPSPEGTRVVCPQTEIKRGLHWRATHRAEEVEPHLPGEGVCDPLQNCPRPEGERAGRELRKVLQFYCSQHQQEDQIPS